MPRLRAHHAVPKPRRLRLAAADGHTMANRSVTMTRTKLEHALDAAARGLPVFPQTGKVPGIRSWPTNASLKQSVIERWWDRWPDADIGIALPADVYVLDADSSAALDALYELDLPETLAVDTQRGVHVYLRVPHELRRLTPRPDALGLYALEGKGRPGPVTWAGSVHPSGHVYSVMHDEPIADMPPELVRAIGPRADRSDITGEATRAERAEWAATARAAGAIAAVHLALVQDALADLAVERRRLAAELPHMPSGWADRFYRAGAVMGPHVAAGALTYETAVERLEATFREHDTDGRDPEHVLRSIARGIATGARAASL